MSGLGPGGGCSKTLILFWWSHSFLDLMMCFWMLSLSKVKLLFITRVREEVWRFLFQKWGVSGVSHHRPPPLLPEPFGLRDAAKQTWLEHFWLHRHYISVVWSCLKTGLPNCFFLFVLFFLTDQSLPFSQCYLHHYPCDVDTYYHPPYFLLLATVWRCSLAVACI